VSPGDSVLLFSRFSYDSASRELPIKVGPGVNLAQTPFAFLSAIKPACLACFVLPGYGLIDTVPHVCLHSPVSEPRPDGLSARQCFFIALPALRLQKPVPLEIAGAFEIGPEAQILAPALFNLRSTWPVGPSTLQFTAQDVRQSFDIAQKVIDVCPKYRCLSSAIVHFSQATCGLITSLQMARMALFAALEALFGGKKSDGGERLAKRANRALGNVDFGFVLEDWLKEEYNRKRNELAHGLQDVVPWSEARPENLESFGRMHEIVRLSLLGWLSCQDYKLERFFSTSVKNTRAKQLDQMSALGGQFLTGQKPECN
jgi:hypothetical protein